MNGEIDKQMLDDFLVEADEHIVNLEQNLLEIEKTPENTDTIINEIFRSAHTIKGMSGMMGFMNLNSLTHKMENVLDKIRNKQLLPSHHIIDVLFSCLDSINAIMKSIKETQSEGNINIENLIKKLENILEGKFEEPKKEIEIRTEETKKKEEEKKEEEEETVDSLYQSEEALNSFKIEALEIIDKFTSDVEELGNDLENYSPEIINDIFRRMHTLKGLSAMFGFKKISKFAHQLENILETIKSKRLKLDNNVFEFLISCSDLFYALLSDVENKTNTVDLSNAYKIIEQITSTIINIKEKIYEIPDNLYKLLNNEDLNKLVAGYEKNKKLYKIKVMIKEEKIDVEAIKVFTDKLALFGEIILITPDFEAIPDIKDFKEEIYYLKLVVLLLSDDEIKVLKEIFGEDIDSIEEIKKRKIKKAKEPVSAKVEKEIVEKIKEDVKEKVIKGEVKEVKGEQQVEAKKDIAAQPIAASEKEKVSATVTKPASLSSNTIRVDIERLDKLMNLVGELVIDRMRLVQIINKLKVQFENELLISDLKGTTERMARVTNELREAIMQTRMVPIGNVFNKYPRVVRDLAKARGKIVNLEIYGETTELDKTIIEEISDLLIHLIRNAIDHGIEDAETRVKKGKKKEGKLVLNAFHEGNHIIIEVEDDGAGIDPEKIKKSAIKKGIMTEEELKKMSEKEIIQIIFRAGFSTAEKVTDLSGRGVGMDVVRENIKKLNGIIEIETEKDKGTKFIIKLPLTLAIINALLIKVGEQIFAIPLAQVIESVIVKPEEIKTIEEQEEVVILRDQVVLLIRLSEFFKIPIEKKEQKKIFIVIVGVAEERCGFIVDSLLGQQEIVIKSLDTEMINSKGIAGATILGEGNVVLILDVAALLNENKKRKEAMISSQAAMA